jgi:hypothetical protein
MRVVLLWHLSILLGPTSTPTSPHNRRHCHSSLPCSPTTATGSLFIPTVTSLSDCRHGHALAELARGHLVNQIRHPPDAECDGSEGMVHQLDCLSGVPVLQCLPARISSTRSSTAGRSTCCGSTQNMKTIATTSQYYFARSERRR